VIIVLEQSENWFVLDELHTLKRHSISVEAVKEISARQDYIKAVYQVLEYGYFYHTCASLIYLPASLNYLVLLAIVIVQHHARGNACPRAHT